MLRASTRSRSRLRRNYTVGNLHICCSTTPRVRPRVQHMFPLEKRLRPSAVTVDVFAAENRRPAFLAINLAEHTPALRRDDGNVLGGTVTYSVVGKQVWGKMLFLE